MKDFFYVKFGYGLRISCINEDETFNWDKTNRESLLAHFAYNNVLPEKGDKFFVINSINPTNPVSIVVEDVIFDTTCFEENEYFVFVKFLK